MFWDSFDAAVNISVGLSGVQKFMYHVQRDATCVIADLPFIDDGDAHSVALLQARAHKIIHAHRESLLSLE